MSDPKQTPPLPSETPVIPDAQIVPEHIERAISLADVFVNIRDPQHWIEQDALRELIIENPSLRGMIYGYVSEAAFVKFLENLKIEKHFKPDDHKKTKSDRTFEHGGRSYTIQLKSLQTNSLKETEPGRFTAKVQNDASDRRKIVLPNGTTMETTCYQVGEYDILGVSLQPFAGSWRFAFKKNKDLRRSAHKKYPPEVQQMLLSHA